MLQGTVWAMAEDPSAPPVRSVPYCAAVAVAQALVASRSKWRPAGKPDDLGATARLELVTGRRRDPGDPASVSDTEERVIVGFQKGA